MRYSWIFLLVMVGCIQDGGGVEPVPPSSEIGKAVQQSKQYHRLLGDQFLEAGKKVESGEITTDREAHNFLSERNKAAREAAFKSVDEYMQSRIGDGKWDRTVSAKVYREIGEALQK